MRLFNLLKSIISSIVSVRSSITTKQDKTWKSLGNTTGTITYSLNGYTEICVYVIFGGVQVGQSIPVSLIPSSGDLTLYVGIYSQMDGRIYVQLSKTSAKISKQPPGYTGTLKIYAR